MRDQANTSACKTSSEESCVYAIQAEHGGPIKIGVTTNLANRLIGIQSGNPSRLRVLQSWPGDVTHEYMAHHRFAAYRLMGEWFEPAGPVLEFVNSPDPPAWWDEWRELNWAGDASHCKRCQTTLKVGQEAYCAPCADVLAHPELLAMFAE